MTKKAMEPRFFTPLDEILFNQRVIQFSGPVNSELAHQVNQQLLAMEAEDSSKPVYLYINSPGGEVQSGFSVFDTIRFITPEVKTVVTGLAASMGSLIAIAAKPENRVALPNSKFLIHQPLLSGTFTGPATDIQIHAQDMVRMKERINRIYAQETGRSYEEVLEATDRDKWMTAEEALEFGLIRKIVEKRSEIE